MRRALAAALAALAAAGCGWRAGVAAPEGASSVGVALFDVAPEVLERDLAPLLHDELTRAVSDLVGAPLVPPSEADVVVRGRIVDYRRRGGIRSPENDLLETGVRIAVEARLERRGGRVVAAARGGVPVGYVTALRVEPDPVTGEERFLMGSREEERDARRRALRFLAEGLVLDLFAPPDVAPPDPADAGVAGAATDVRPLLPGPPGGTPPEGPAPASEPSPPLR